MGYLQMSIKSRGKVIGVYVGKKEKNPDNTETAIHKKKVNGVQKVLSSGIIGDEHASATHGTIDRALCFYPFENYKKIEEKFGYEKIEGIRFGENISFVLTDESDFCIGDKIKVGSTISFITQPRYPCGVKLAG